MDFAAVFHFFSENVELTPAQRTAELICVSGTAILLAVLLGVLLYRKVKKCRAQQQTENDDGAL